MLAHAQNTHGNGHGNAHVTHALVLNRLQSSHAHPWPYHTPPSLPPLLSSEHGRVADRPTEGHVAVRIKHADTKRGLGPQEAMTPNGERGKEGGGGRGEGRKQ